MTQILNDLLFESETAQAEFLEAEKTMSHEDIERFRAVLGKPSQFVGRVGSLAAAKEHWRQWAIWEQEDKAYRAQLAAVIVETPEGADLPKRRGRPVNPERVESKQAIELAREAWHTAVRQVKDYELQVDNWATETINQTRQTARDLKEQAQKHLAEKREEYRRLTRR